MTRESYWWERTIEEIRRSARGWRLKPEDLEDVTQEVALRLLHTGRSIVSLRGWIAVVVRRVAYDLHRTQHRKLDAGTSQHDKTETPGGTPAVTTALEFDLVLRRLPERDAQLLRHVAAGCTHRTIAARMGWHTRDVGVRIARAVLKASRAAGTKTSRQRSTSGQDRARANTGNRQCQKRMVSTLLHDDGRNNTLRDGGSHAS